jgi:hypothetical protein
MKTYADVALQFKAARGRSLTETEADALPEPRRLSMGGAYVRGRAIGRERGKAIAAGLYIACGCVLAAITMLLCLHPGHASDVALGASLVADVVWLAGFSRV